eukprot:CAMPEP_0171461838 /NCGR_PEP_ID=MMETSP0945-20130129/6122_1 /TAXON_ID=109269 /ORGANISM="Vaucheria litorea, Strain CCMP2940" /LENGTH=256 /DNA_ID=CAMNT_0011988257 /DNA_START=42 /DNA_END=810 /DNA_ORIENTATION=-
MSDPIEGQQAPKKRIRSKKKRKQTEDSKEKKSAVDEKMAVEGDDHTVYAQGFPFVSTDENVRKFFEKFGTIKELNAPKFHDSNRLLGYAVVTFEKAESASKAIEQNGCSFEGRYLEIEKSKKITTFFEKQTLFSKKLPNSECKTIFVKNLPYDVTEQDLKSAFDKFGIITNARLAEWGHTKLKKGFGYVDFADSSSVTEAIKQQMTVRIGGRNVLVSFDEGRPKGSFKLHNGMLYEKNLKKGESQLKKKAKFGTNE